MHHRAADAAHIESAELPKTFGDSIDHCRISVRRPLSFVHEGKGAVDGQRVYVLADEIVDSRGRPASRHQLANLGRRGPFVERNKRMSQLPRESVTVGRRHRPPRADGDIPRHPPRQGPRSASGRAVPKNLGVRDRRRQVLEHHDFT